METTGLSIGYRQKNGRRNVVVHDALDLALFPGEVTCLLGLNGAGKSTLLRTLCGFQPPLKGDIRLLGKPLERFSQTGLALTIGVVLTEKTYAGGITVYELVSLGRHPYTGFFGRLKKGDRRVVEQSMEAAGIAHKALSYVAELSDGERQKAMIAKTLAQECPVILLDEPTAFLDVTSRIETMILLRRLAVEQQKTILLTTHDMDSAIRMGDCLWLLGKERPMVCGAPEDLILDGSLALFFGKEDIAFDPTTGKLSSAAPARTIGVEGDSLTAYWVGNALVRNGFRPAPAGNGQINILCMDRQQIEITFPGGKKKSVSGIAGLIAEIRQNKNKNKKLKTS